MSTLSIPSTSPTWFQSISASVSQWRMRRDAERVQRLALRARAQRHTSSIALTRSEDALPAPIAMDADLDLAQRVRLVGEW